jgi:hypothetical protein
MVKSLINWGIKPQQIGIIALCTSAAKPHYHLTAHSSFADKPQAYKIETALAAVKATDISEGAHATRQ